MANLHSISTSAVRSHSMVRGLTKHRQDHPVYFSVRNFHYVHHQNAQKTAKIKYNCVFKRIEKTFRYVMCVVFLKSGQVTG